MDYAVRPGMSGGELGLQKGLKGLTCQASCSSVEQGLPNETCGTKPLQEKNKLPQMLSPFSLARSPKPLPSCEDVHMGSGEGQKVLDIPLLRDAAGSGQEEGIKANCGTRLCAFCVSLLLWPESWLTLTHFLTLLPWASMKEPSWPLSSQFWGPSTHATASAPTPHFSPWLILLWYLLYFPLVINIIIHACGVQGETPAYVQRTQDHTGVTSMVVFLSLVLRILELALLF